MTAEQLIEEGRMLERPCTFLRPEVSGEVAAIWYERDEDEIEETGHHCWLTVDSHFVPGWSSSTPGFISVFTDDMSCEGGRIEVAAAWPKRNGTKLYAFPASVLPPLDAVFVRGSDAVGNWLRENNWQRDWPYNNNFKGEEIAEKYQDIWRKEFPLYFNSDIYAVLGGWHWPAPEGDWNDLIDEQLIALTIRDSEPWVEAWRMKSGEFKVIQRIT